MRIQISKCDGCNAKLDDEKPHRSRIIRVNCAADVVDLCCMCWDKMLAAVGLVESGTYGEVVKRTGERAAPMDSASVRTAYEIKEWCLASIAKLVAEFGPEEALKMLEEKWLGQAVDPDGRPLFRRRSYPVSGGWLIVRTSNLGGSGERPGRDEAVIAAGIPDRVAADQMCEALVERCSGDDAPWFYKVEPDGYDLKMFKP